MIKYLGSKRRLVPIVAGMARAVGARTAADLFTGTTRVARALKAGGAFVTAVDVTRCASTLAECYVATDASTVDRDRLAAAVDALDRLPGEAGFFTEHFCADARFFTPENGARIDAVRDAVEGYRGTPLYPVLLTSLIEAADRVDSTVGIQAAYLKEWAARALTPMRLRVPDLIPGPGRALRADAREAAKAVGPVDFAYLDPPYNQHRYDVNYHVWETLVAWDRPQLGGVTKRRADLAGSASVFNRRDEMPGALDATIRALDAEVVVLSYNDESWLSLDDLTGMCAHRGAVEVVSVPCRRYIGTKIGGGAANSTGGRDYNLEHLVVSGPAAAVERAMSYGHQPTLF